MTSAALTRFPVLHTLDGDLSTAEILDALATVTAARHAAARPAAATAALAGRLWRLPTADPRAVTTAAVGHLNGGLPSADDLRLLHAFETSALWRVPVAQSTAALDPAAAAAWMVIAEHWIAVHTATGDLRWLNAACKLLGVVWVHYVAAVGASPSTSDWRGITLTRHITTTAYLIHEATNRLAEHLSTRLIPHIPTASVIDLSVIPPVRQDVENPPRIMLLCGAGSAGARRLLAAAVYAHLPIAHVSWYGTTPDPSSAKQTSAYASAWYPPEAEPAAGDRQAPAHPYPSSDAADWDAVTSTIHGVQPDVVLLVGMPIVPADVLDLAPLGFVNAHNGALPQYRGMDAVGWAILNNDPVICSIHIALPQVDSGGVLTAAPVPLQPLGTLRTRVRDTQLSLLLNLMGHLANTGCLPATTTQHQPQAQLFYRLHPHLKRVLDASPYGQSIGGQP
jgi:folate-dependent phosphoribosylglycinamide formyltransferase PurN